MQVRPQSTSRAVEEVLSQRLLAQVGYILAMCRRYSADRVRRDGDRKTGRRVGRTIQQLILLCTNEVIG